MDSSDPNSTSVFRAKKLVITCPNTGKDIDTQKRFSTIPKGTLVGATIQCSHCGQKHPWTWSDTRLV